MSPCISAGAGYMWRPGNNRDGLATVFEIAPSYSFSRHLSANLYYGHAFGREVIKSVYAADPGADFFSVELKDLF